MARKNTKINNQTKDCSKILWEEVIATAAALSSAWKNFD